MAGIKNTQVVQEVEKLLGELKKTDLAQYNIIQNLLDDVYMDPTLGSETVSKEIENKLYKMVDDHIQFLNTNSKEEESDN